MGLHVDTAAQFSTMVIAIGATLSLVYFIVTIFV